MAQYDQIQAKNYNDVRKSISTILGSGTGAFGYGQALASFDVKEGMEIDKAHFDYLKLDMDRCLRHQTGLDSTIVDIPAVIQGKEIKWSTIVSYQLLADRIIENRDSFYTGASTGQYVAQMDIVNGGSRRLGSGWGVNSAGQRYAEQLYYVTWSTNNAARYFFNTGGYLRITASWEGAATNTKSVGWGNTVTRLNDLPFTFTAAEYRQAIAGTQTEFSVKVNDLTNPYYTNYAFARFVLINSKTIQVLVQYVDNDAGNHDPATDTGLGPFGVGIDEPVTIDILSGLEYRKAKDAVIVETPTFTVSNFVLPYNQTSRVYSTPGIHTMIVPPGVTSLKIIMAGGGGGGSAGTLASGEEGGAPGAGGGGGETFLNYLTVVPLETITMYVGAGGTGGSFNSHRTIVNPTNGGDSSIASSSGSTLIARGGKGAKGTTGGISGNGKSGSSAGGGGGSGSASITVNGGDGLAYQSDTTITIGGGGAGGGGSGGTGGVGGGADTGASALAGTGGGGGGAITPSSYSSTGGNGGCGTIIIFG